MSPKKTYRIVTLTYNGQKIFNLPHTYQEPRSMMIYFTLNHYRKIEANGMMDPMQQVLNEVLPKYPFLRPVADRMVSSPAENARYLPWLKNYLQSIIGEPVTNLSIDERWVHFSATGRVIEDSSKILYTVQ